MVSSFLVVREKGGLFCKSQKWPLDIRSPPQSTMPSCPKAAAPTLLLLLPPPTVWGPTQQPQTCNCPSKQLSDHRADHKAETSYLRHVDAEPCVPWPGQGGHLSPGMELGLAWEHKQREKKQRTLNYWTPKPLLCAAHITSVIGFQLHKKGSSVGQRAVPPGARRESHGPVKDLPEALSPVTSGPAV